MTHQNNRPDPAALRFCPPRYRWLRRFSVLIGSLLLILVLLHGVWHLKAFRALQAEIARIEAANEPIHLLDLVSYGVLNHENRVHLLQQVLQQWPRVPGLDQPVTQTRWFKRPEEHDDPIQDATAYLHSVRRSLAQIHQAAEAPGCDWGRLYRRPLIFDETLTPDYGPVLELGRLLEDAAKRAIRNQQTSLALDLLTALNVLISTINVDPPSGLAFVYRTRIESCAYRTLETFLPDIGATLNPTSRRDLEIFGQSLVDETDIQAAFIQSLLGERWLIHDTCNAFQQGLVAPRFLPSPINRWVRPILLPLYRQDTLFALQYYSHLIEATRQTTTHPEYETFVAQQMRSSDIDADLERYWYRHPITRFALWKADNLHLLYFRSLGRRRLAATAIAIELYRIDHGQRPDTLQALIPDYLPHLPPDPFSPTSAVLGYQLQAPLVWFHDPEKPVDRKGPAILYSVGMDGIDQQGVIFLDREGMPMGNHHFRDGKSPHDFWFALDAEKKPQVPAPDA